MKKLLPSAVLLLTLAATFTGCATVKPYQRVYLNDAEMGMGSVGASMFEENIQAYREGAIGGGSRKLSGGCGCN